MSLRDKIRAAQDATSETVDIAEWDVSVEIRSMSAGARARFLNQAVGADGTMDFQKIYPSMLIACCFDPESGEPLFDQSDAEWLNGKAAGPVERLAQAGMRLSGLSENAVDEAKKES